MKIVLVGLMLLCVTLGGGYLVFKKGRTPFSTKELNICVADNQVYPKACTAAATDPEAFKHFKRSAYFNLIEEYDTFEEGKEYLTAICGDVSFPLDKIELFRKNDQEGNPRIFNYEQVGFFSPTTLRHMKIAADLVAEYGDLSQQDVVEIGGGYGGQCYALSVLSGFKSYTIVDLPECLELAQVYLAKYGIENVRFISLLELPKETACDLVFSHYAFSEMDKSVQKTCVERLLRGAKQGHLICHQVPKHFRVRPYAQKKLLEELKAVGLLCEIKQQDEVVFTWKKDQ